jgi:hypothetical protein
MIISSNLCNEVFLGDELLENVFIIRHFRDRFHQPLLKEADTYSGTVNTTFHAHNETNFMHYLSSVYSVTIPLHVLGLLVAHQQEVAVYICNKWHVLY